MTAFVTSISTLNDQGTVRWPNQTSVVEVMVTSTVKRFHPSPCPSVHVLLGVAEFSSPFGMRTSMPDGERLCWVALRLVPPMEASLKEGVVPLVAASQCIQTCKSSEKMAPCGTSIENWAVEGVAFNEVVRPRVVAENEGSSSSPS